MAVNTWSKFWRAQCEEVALGQEARTTSALLSRADVVIIQRVRPLCAMCERLRLGKNFLHVTGLVGAAMCSA